MPSRAEYLATLPRKRVSAGVLIRDPHGRVLLVEPTYRPDWLLPGGVVEAHEPPSRAAAREVLEELGLTLPIGRPLVMQWVQAEDDPLGALHFVHDGGTVDVQMIEGFRLPPSELTSYRFVEVGAIAALVSPTTAARVAAAIDAGSRGVFVELEA